MSITTAETTPKVGRRKGRRFAAVVASTACVAALLTGCISQDQSSVQSMINADRSSNNIGPLADYNAADAKAQAWANHLASLDCTPTNCLSHTNLTDGYTPGTWCHLGENVGMGDTLAAVNDGFMNSPPHRANILGTAYDHMGTGVARNATTGYVFVVQEFVDLC